MMPQAVLLGRAVLASNICGPQALRGLRHRRNQHDLHVILAADLVLFISLEVETDVSWLMSVVGVEECTQPTNSKDM
jgi:hypothetical protein